MKKFIKGVLIFLGVLFVLGCVFVGYIIVDMEKQENLLDKEVNKLLNMDLATGVVDMNIVTKDEYAVIERTIKSYLKDYSDNCKKFINAIDNFDFENMFTAKTFASDGPDFLNSKGKLSQLKGTLNDSLGQLIQMSSKEYIMELIDEKDLDEYDIEMYENYMFGDNINSFNDYISKDVNEMRSLSENVNLFLGDCYALYDFMSNNRSYWYVEGDIVYFSSNGLVNEYNALLNKIIVDSNKLTEYDSNESEESNSGSVGSV